MSERDLALLDEVVAQRGIASRSAAVRMAIRVLRHEMLVQAYVEEFTEWEATQDKSLWDGVPTFGLDDEVWP